MRRARGGFVEWFAGVVSWRFGGVGSWSGDVLDANNLEGCL